MNKKKLEATISIQLSNYPEAIKNVEAILSLAKQHKEQSGVLSACASIIMVAVLDQATWSLLLAAENADLELEYDSVGCFNLRQTSLKTRVLDLPALLTHKKMQINRKSPKVRALCQLIDFRNSLLHVREGIITKKVSIDWDGVNDPVFNLDEVLSRKFGSPWKVLKLDDAINFKAAFLAYNHAVLWPAPEHIKPGEIIKKT